MNFVQAIILGIVEGATEYLPISSTFHLIWTAKILGISQTDFQKLFEVFIQAGAIAAVVVMYFKTILNDRKIDWRILASFIPTSIVGLLLYKVIKGYFFDNNMLQLMVFLIVGIAFILFERFGKEKLVKTMDQITLKDAVMVGLAQSLAVVPGVSRAGAVMVALMLLKVKREEAAKYSFLLAVPTIFAASALDLIKMRSLVSGNLGNVDLLVTGTVAAFISALVVIKWLISFLQKHSLEAFGWYRIIGFIFLISLFR